MSRIAALIQRYEAAESLIKYGAEVIAVGDPAGSRLNDVIRRALFAAGDDLGVWDDLICPAKMLRWRLITHLQPAGPSSACKDAITEVIRRANQLRGAVADDGLLDELAAAARGAAESETPLSDALIGLIDEVEPQNCLLVAASKPAQMSLTDGWGPLGVRVLTAAELAREETYIEQAYAVGPPRFFAPSLVTAPAAFSVTFLIPSWVRDRTVPSSVISSYADSGAIRIRSRVHVLGRDDLLGVSIEGTPELDNDLFPQPVWEETRAPLREPGSDEVEARKVLLSGGYSTWLDDSDGERIRTLDPTAPAGERVLYARLATVRAGTYLLLRQGETEHGALHEIALRFLGDKVPSINATQQAWKEQLSRRISERGHARVAAELRRHGVKAADRARAWTEPSLNRPNNDDDFRKLLVWLGIPIEPTFANATMLRRAHHQAGTYVRERLERAVDAADLAGLDRDGHLSLDVPADGFRRIIATRVLAISPHAEFIARRNARLLFVDRSARWLE